jgi:predicted transcriptional regulator
MLTPLELDIMKAVWRGAPITVRDVQIALRPLRKPAYTTVMTMMNRLYHKGFLTRILKSRAHIYEPAIPYAEVRQAAVNGLIENFFSGSREQLQEFLEADLIERVTPVSPAQTSSLDETLL